MNLPLTITNFSSFFLPDALPSFPETSLFCIFNRKLLPLRSLSECLQPPLRSMLLLRLRRGRRIEGYPSQPSEDAEDRSDLPITSEEDAKDDENRSDRSHRKRGRLIHTFSNPTSHGSSHCSECCRIVMGISKLEVNFRRLLAAAPQQQNQAKLVHYVATLREQLEQLAEERTAEGLPRISKATLNDYSEKIEAIASKLVNLSHDIQVSEDSERNSVKEKPSEIEEKEQVPLSSGLRRRPVSASITEDRTHEPTETDQSAPIKLDAAAQSHIEKHRKLQEDLTDEMVVLARQLKESSLMMNQSLQNTEKILDSTEEAIEHSLASTGRVNARATTIYSESSKTSCLTWLVIFVMTCVFVMVVLLIRVT